MKKICFVAVFLFSKIVLSASEESPTSLILAVNDFLNQFQVARIFKESKDDFLKRVIESKKFESIIYKGYPEKLFQCDAVEKIDDDKKRYLLSLFTPDIHVVKNCGFWGGSQDGFHVCTGTKVLGKNSAKFQEKGLFEWQMQFSRGLSGNEFENTPIQALLNYLIAQKESNFVISLENKPISVFVIKEEKQITTRLQYK